MQQRLYGSRWHGVAIGLLSTLAGLAVAELVVGLFRGASSPVLPVGQEVIDVVPRSVKQWAVDWFGTADKAVLILGTLLSLAVVGSIVGILAVRGARAAAYAVTAIVGVIGVWAVTMRPDPTFGKLMPPVVGTLVSVGVLWYLAPRDVAPGDLGVGATGSDDVAGGAVGDGGTVAVGVGRRGFLRGAAGVAAGSAVAALLGRSLKKRFEVADEIASTEIPDAASSPLPGESAAEALVGAVDGPREFGIDKVTPWQVPNDDFYRIDTALAVPQVSKDSWTLRIHGMVDHEMELTFADLLARPMIERYVTLSCVSNEIGGGLVGNALFQGVRLKELLEEAGIQEGATQMASRSVDGWTCGAPTSAIMDGRDAMIAIGMNGEALPAEHGYPARLVVPGLYGYVSATKWVTEIELVRWEDFDGYWVPRGWAKEAPIKTMARIDRPRRSRSYTANQSGVVDIAGLAWAVHRGISKVEVQIDDGEWLECELAGVPSDDTWREWRYQWRDAPAGDHVVQARAYDGAGEPQPVGPKSVAPDGAEGYHSVKFTVE